MPKRKRSNYFSANKAPKRFNSMPFNRSLMPENFYYSELNNYNYRVPPIPFGGNDDQVRQRYPRSRNQLIIGDRYLNYPDSFRDDSLAWDSPTLNVTISGNRFENRYVDAFDIDDRGSQNDNGFNRNENLDRNDENSKNNLNQTNVDERTISQDLEENANIIACCYNRPYLICKDTPDTLLSTCVTSPPDFLIKLQSAVASKGNNRMLRFVCRICDSGTMSNFNNLLDHLKGKIHSKKIKLINAENTLKIKLTLCRSCFKINCYPSNSEEDDMELPKNFDEIFNQILPNIKQKSKGEPLKMNTTKNKHVATIDLILSNIDTNFTFPLLFDELVKFSKEYTMDLQYVCIVNKPNEIVAYCRFFRSLLKPQIFFDEYIVLNRCRIDVEVMQFDNDMFERIQEDFKANNTGFEWSIGHFTPCCEIFRDWDKLVPFIDWKLKEMEEANEDYDRLTSFIGRDLMRSISSFINVKSIDFFGSRVTGLALHTNDFDLQMTTEGLCTVRGLAKHLKPLFTIREVIPWAKVPIIRIEHMGTGSKCDVSLNNMNGVINSQLLRFYLDMDERVKWLVVTVKLWASMNLINGSFAFTSYGLAWLVLFFLMEEEVSLVPPVQTLVDLPTSNRFLLYSEETNMSLSLDMNGVMKIHNPKLKCKLKKKHLLHSFFKYCLRVSSSQDALDPYTGKTITRMDLAKSDRIKLTEGNLSKERNLHRSSFIIIDPIKHSANICATVNSKVLKNFIALVNETIKLLSESEKV